MNQKNNVTRRDFVQKATLATGAASLGLTNLMKAHGHGSTFKRPLSIDSFKTTFEREPLIHSYGFKGGYITRLWQVVAQLQDTLGNKTIGLGVHSPLWSDSRVTSAWGESGSNSAMYNLTCRALQMIEGQSFETPIHMVEDILDEVWAYGTKITNNADLRTTFALNALTSIDNSAWMLYAKQNNITSFIDLIPNKYKAAFSHKNTEIASIPSISYSTSVSDIEALKDEGYFFIKIKIGAPGSQQEMLEKDMRRMEQIHNIFGTSAAKTDSGRKIVYYLDANGRYESKDTLKRLLDHCKKIKVLDHIAIVEEPFPESLDVDVSDLGVRIAADESAHTDTDALKRIEMGYTGIALKPMGKTLSMTIKIAKLAHDRNIPCFCTDLTVNPVLVDWNKCIASRLKPFPGQDLGLLETNGGQNYRNWETMIGYHPRGNASWNQVENGAFTLGEDFFKESGGIFLELEHYNSLFKE
ncbi:enolase C-terminal domain-like protein [Flagellimonas iocasae]|uniref:Enolase C-terminal domain-like protein n=1 Tax=Flagellimonas iocasae TaxID=2055905 RepID=A0ABW4Y140_9FLAO